MPQTADVMDPGATVLVPTRQNFPILLDKVELARVETALWSVPQRGEYLGAHLCRTGKLWFPRETIERGSPVGTIKNRESVCACEHTCVWSFSNSTCHRAGESQKGILLWGRN